LLDIYKRIGFDQLRRNIDFVVHEEYKQTAGQYSAEEQLSKREEIRSRSLEKIKTRLKQQDVDVKDFAIINFDFQSEEFKKAIEAKQVANQEVLKAEQEAAKQDVLNRQRLAVAETEKQETILRAEAQSESQRLQQQSLTPLFLQIEWIRKWNGQLPSVLTGEEGMLLNIPAAPTTPNP
jgi:regulator of protease activity HflC (stomatin/prohibitin superfamily)